jgi:hypothetical protein
MFVVDVIDFRGRVREYEEPSSRPIQEAAFVCAACVLDLSEPREIAIAARWIEIGSGEL